ncbi:MAG: contractile injection system protein, VgrG/Pvc8 family [Chloroflexaceae bacterium]|jgi:phage protein D|nr:contractile injection system protein, VgrG/Pvc8 family [Chloroflexaceae bacterium]
MPTAYIARPTVLLDNQPDSALGADLVAAMVEESSAGLFRCEARFNNFGPRNNRLDYLYFDRARLDFGKAFGLEFGPPNASRRVFSGRISALEAEYMQGNNPHITVLAEDRLQDLRMTRRTRSFEDSSDADIIEQIARDHSLSPDVNLPGPTHRVVAQVNLSDLAFIRERARACGGEVWLDETTLHVAARPDRGNDTVTLAYGVDLLSFSVRADLSEQCTELGVSGWDVASKTAIAETAAEAAVSAELNGDSSGGSLLAQAFGERRARVVHTVPLTTSEARTMAESRYRERARRFVTGTGLAEGIPALRVGSSLTLSRLGSMFDGSYTVVRVRHTYDLASGFRTEFDLERPGIGRSS